MRRSRGGRLFASVAAQAAGFAGFSAQQLQLWHFGRRTAEVQTEPGRTFRRTPWRRPIGSSASPGAIESSFSGEHDCRERLDRFLWFRRAFASQPCYFVNRLSGSLRHLVAAAHERACDSQSHCWRKGLAILRCERHSWSRLPKNNSPSASADANRAVGPYCNSALDATVTATPIPTRPFSRSRCIPRSGCREKSASPADRTGPAA